MCGIAGFLAVPGQFSAESLTELAGNMAARLQHRGPDDQGTWCDPAAGVALGHQRLAVIDLSEQGHQPILSSCGGYVLVYNGEIYNYKALRTELEQAGRRFRGDSDTEVLLEAISCWGIAETLPKLRGMFAFAVWNRRERILTLVRDRLGIKPLYYARFGATVLFASELKGLKVHPAFQAEIDPQAVALQLRHNYIPAPYSIYQRVRKLPAGHLLEIPITQNSSSADSTGAESTQVDYGAMRSRSWWSLEEVIRRGTSQPFSGDYEEAVTQLEQLLKESVSLRMLADVPLGAFLSGGIDSSLTVALMQQQSSRAVKTFTIGFTEYAYDESPYARRISEHLGTDHTELCVMPSEAMGVIPKLAAMYDEPFSDMSQIPTYLVCKLARRDVTVALSGDGGDELFGGYNRYFHIGKIWNILNRVPARKLLFQLVDSHVKYSPFPWKKASLKHYAQLLEISSAHELYSQLHRHWTPAEILQNSVDDPSESLGFGRELAGLTDLRSSWMALDTLTYLPEDILTKVDRASMAVSLEARVPLLDHQVVEFAWSLPREFCFEQTTGKKILQSVLERHVPRSLFDRPKTGFGVPLGEWLRGSLFDWAENLLSEKSLAAHGLFHADIVRQRWQDHLQGKVNWQYPLWDVLMFQAWYEQQQQQ